MNVIDSLEIDAHILEKIESKHGINFNEIEEACFSDYGHVRRGREGLYKIFNKLESGRYILVVLADHGEGLWKVVTAREMTGDEKRLYAKVMRG
jgi:uncharacterized DUF497 family protein